MFLWWRLFYGTLGSRWCVALLRFLVRVADWVKPGAALAVLETRIGEWWPRAPGWVNIHVSGLFWRLRRRALPQDRRHAQRPRRRSRPLRVGCFGAFSGLLGFPPPLFAAFPPDAELFVYDLQFGGQHALALARLARSYLPLNLESARTYTDAVGAAADAINADDLDLLLVIREKVDAHDVLDHVRTPCVAHVCTGSGLLHHPNVDFHLYCQPEADFFPVGNELFCGFTRKPIPHRIVYPAFLYFDPRGLDLAAAVPRWEERSPLILFHGSLYKLAAPEFLDCLFGVLAEFDEVEFVFMGRDSGGALERVRKCAQKWGVEQRAQYEGSFSTTRDAEGQVTDPGWYRLLALLGRARLAPDPWPVGGASARFEAYVMGVPTVHMGLSTDSASWGRAQHALCEIPNLLVPEATARSVDEYRSLMVRCLRDSAFAKEVAMLQRGRAKASCAPSEYWEMIQRAYDDWSRVGPVLTSERHLG